MTRWLEAIVKNIIEHERSICTSEKCILDIDDNDANDNDNEINSYL